MKHQIFNPLNWANQTIWFLKQINDQNLSIVNGVLGNFSVHTWNKKEHNNIGSS